MKRISALIFCIILLLSPCGCRRFIEDDITSSVQAVSEEAESNSDTSSYAQSNISSEAVSSSSENKLSGENYLSDESYVIIANSKTKKYHERNCRYVEKIKLENIIGFEDVNEAIDKDYTPCSVCFK